MALLSEVCKYKMENVRRKLNDIFKCRLKMPFTICIKISLDDHGM